MTNTERMTNGSIMLTLVLMLMIESTIDWAQAVSAVFFRARR